MQRTLRLLTFLALLPALCAGPAAAQEPKPGRDWYEDAVDIGFKFKAPDGWGFVPPQADDLGLVGKYVAPGSQFLQNPKSGEYWDYTLYILKLDRREPAGDGEKKGKRGKNLGSLPELVEAAFGAYKLRKVEEKDGKVGKIPTTEYRFEGTIGQEYAVGLYAVLFKLRPDIEVALAFNGPEKNWKKFETAFKKISGTFQPIAVAAAGPAAAGGKTPRDEKRSKLVAEVAKSPGWELHETENYFVISSNDDREFNKELLERLEAVREVYEETYPPKLAEELRLLVAQRRLEEGEKGGGEEAGGSGGNEGGEDEGEDEGEPADEPQDPGEDVTSSPPPDPMELSRTSVVRVCKDRDEYISYGGPGGSAGYWHPVLKELVIYDDKAVGGRRNTWATLNHEAFHQYIFYFFGSLTPHYWYNEGTGDFYSGYEYKNGKFNLKPFDWRQRTVQESVRKGSFVPLKEFVRFDREKYYDRETIGENYAQGWALVYFLRTGKKNARCWNDRWDTILDTYLRVLVETDDLDEAVDKAFAGVDWDKFEQCWKTYTLQ